MKGMSYETRKIGDLIIGPNDVKMKIVSEPFLTKEKAIHVLETSMIFNRKYGYVLLNEDEYWYIVELDVLIYNIDKPQYINGEYLIKSIPFYSEKSAKSALNYLLKGDGLGENSTIKEYEGAWYIVESRSKLGNLETSTTRTEESNER